MRWDCGGRVERDSRSQGRFQLPAGRSKNKVGEGGGREGGRGKAALLISRRCEAAALLYQMLLYMWPTGLCAELRAAPTRGKIKPQRRRRRTRQGEARRRGAKRSEEQRRGTTGRPRKEGPERAAAVGPRLLAADLPRSSLGANRFLSFLALLKFRGSCYGVWY